MTEIVVLFTVKLIFLIENLNENVNKWWDCKKYVGDYI